MQVDYEKCKFVVMKQNNSDIILAKKGSVLEVMLTKTIESIQKNRKRLRDRYKELHEKQLKKVERSGL